MGIASSIAPRNKQAHSNQFLTYSLRSTVQAKTHCRNMVPSIPNAKKLVTRGESALITDFLIFKIFSHQRAKVRMALSGSSRQGPIETQAPAFPKAQDLSRLWLHSWAGFLRWGMAPWVFGRVRWMGALPHPGRFWAHAMTALSRGSRACPNQAGDE